MEEHILPEEPIYLDKSLQLIENKLQWRNRDLWTQEEFTKLSQLIYEASRITISVKTLKRLFGKVKTHSHYNPQADTKNALAIFLGYKHWDDFKKQLHADLSSLPETGALPINQEKLNLFPESITPAAVQPVLSKRNKKFNFRLAGVLLVLLLVLGGLGGVWYNKSQKPGEQAARFSFSGKNLTGLIPFTAVFNYDVSQLKADSVFLDIGKHTRPIPLNKTKQVYAHTFIYPNYYRTKLLADKQELARLNVHAVTNGWHGIIYYANIDNALHPSPTTFIRHDSVMYIRPQNTKENTAIGTQYRNIRNFDLDGDNMAYETRLKANIANGELMCYDYFFTLVGENDNFLVKFVSPGCFRWVFLQFSEQLVDGKEVELAQFARDLTQWHTVRLEVKNKKVAVLLDGRPIYKTSYQKPIGQLKGIMQDFRVYGMVDYIRMYNDQNQLVYQDEFNQ